MFKADRTILYFLAGAACVLALRAGSSAWTGAAAVAAPPPSKAEPPVTRLATCDVFALVDRVLQSEAFFTPRKQDEETARSSIAPLQSSLMQLQEDLKGADPNKPENQAKGREFENKKSEYKEVAKKLQDQHVHLVAQQFIDAYDKVRDAVGKVAKERGFTNVASQRGGKVRLLTDPQKLAEEFLSRPYSFFPEDSDITDAVRVALNLPEKATTESPTDPAAEAKPADPKPGDKK